jgi:hypothetical protein
VNELKTHVKQEVASLFFRACPDDAKNPHTIFPATPFGDRIPRSEYTWENFSRHLPREKYTVFHNPLKKDGYCG